MTIHRSIIVGACWALMATDLHAQRPATDAGARSDALASLRVRVLRASPGDAPLARAQVRSGTLRLRTDANGAVQLQLPAGLHVVVSTMLGFRPDTLRITLRAGMDTSVDMRLEANAAAIEGVVVSATRGERRVEDTPLRVEVIDEEEVAEKVTMSPGDIAMMLNETSGLRVQTTNPSLGGASVRIQGLLGRYSLILADGLPLYGGQSGGLGLLQIPPVDLGKVEIIKGTASALYGSSALGGVINLISRRPDDAREATLLANQTSRGGTDAVAFLSGPMSDAWGYTVLAGAHTQSRNDLDADGWTDMPGFDRVVVRPRLYFNNGQGHTAFFTGGVTRENRSGGTLDGATVPGGIPFAEQLRTRRVDVGALTRWVIAADDALATVPLLRGAIVTLRGSAVEQRHEHDFGGVSEDDAHRTWFGEAAIAIPRGRATYIVGSAYQRDEYRSEQLPAFDYQFSIPALFAQTDVDVTRWLSLSASVRLDAHNEYGTFVNPRVSLLLRPLAEGPLSEWTTRVSAGTGAFAPTPFTEETEATGLSPLRPFTGLRAERARSASVDIGGPLTTRAGRMELNATAFGSRIASPLQVVDLGRAATDGAAPLGLANGIGATRTWGGELLARVSRGLGESTAEGEESPVLRVTGSYTYLRSTQCDPNSAAASMCARQDVSLTPRHAAGVVTTIEQEHKSRIGLELYFTGTQRLENNPFRSMSKPYLIVGLLGERAFETRAGVARVFVNLENLTNVRQTRFDPLLLPVRGQGGRWATDAWTDLSGFTANAGVRFGLGAREEH